MYKIHGENVTLTFHMTGKNSLELECDNHFKSVAETEKLFSNKLSLNSSNISIAVDGSITNMQLHYINFNINKTN